MDLDAKRREEPGRLFRFDFEPEARRTTAGQPFRSESAAMVREQALRNAIAGEQIMEAEASRYGVFADSMPPDEEFPAHHVLNGDHDRPSDMPVREADHHVARVTVDVDQLQRMQILTRT